MTATSSDSSYVHTLHKVGKTFDLCYIEPGDMVGVVGCGGNPNLVKMEKKNIILKFEILPLIVYHRRISFVLNPNSVHS